MTDRPALRLRLLGTFHVRVGDVLVPEESWKGRRARDIVKLLALAPLYRHHRERVMDALWPDLDLGAQANNLNVAVSRARRALTTAGAPSGVFLTREGEQLILGPTDLVWVDVETFQQEMNEGWLAGEPARLRSALAHYAGDLLPDDPYEPWLEDRRTALRSSYLALLLRLGQIHEERGESAYAVESYQRLLATDPIHEEAHVALMRLQAASGQRSLALAHYEHLSQLLMREADAEPQRATTQLALAIRDGTFQAPIALVVPSEHQSLPRSMPPVALPNPVSDLIGRETEIAEIRQALSSGRLVTLTGPGGIGKTRLAIAAAHEIAAAFPEGAYFADLAPVRDLDLIEATIAQTLDIRDSGGRSLLDGLRGHLRDRRLLLVLDNFEHLTEGGTVVSTLLESAPYLKVLITSRIPLRLRGEREYSVAPLAVPDPRVVPDGELTAFPAVRLFLQRAREVRPDFEIAFGIAPVVVEICRRLDGLPLAIELAAVRTKVLTPHALLSRLDRPLALLVGGARDLSPRQRTIRDTISWSHDLLTPEEQVVFRRLAVFVGGFTLEAAEAVVPASQQGGDRFSVFEGITSLVDQSLIVKRGSAESEDDHRFRMLETIREFALERLTDAGEREAIGARHAAWCLVLAEEAEPRLEGFGGEQGRWITRLDAELGNLRAALDWFHRTGDATRLLRLTAILDVFWFQRPYAAEAIRWLEIGLASAHEVSDAILGMALHVLVTLAYYQGDNQTAIARGEEELALAAKSADPFLLGRANYGLGLAWATAGDATLAAGYFAAAVPLMRQANAVSWIYLVLASFGDMVHWGGDIETAASLLDEALELVQRVDHADPFALQDRVSFSRIMYQRALVSCTQKDWARAGRLFSDSLSIAREEGDDRHSMSVLVGIAGLAMNLEQAERGARLIGAAASAREATGFSRNHSDLHTRRIEAEVRAHLGEAHYVTEFEAGRSVPLEQAVADALALATLALNV